MGNTMASARRADRQQMDLAWGWIFEDVCLNYRRISRLRRRYGVWASEIIPNN